MPLGGRCDIDEPHALCCIWTGHVNRPGTGPACIGTLAFRQGMRSRSVVCEKKLCQNYIKRRSADESPPNTEHPPPFRPLTLPPVILQRLPSNRSRPMYLKVERRSQRKERSG
ncbi:hypothetical protein M433DRAFT_362920 [Acidomyces richmondensis BFW]|nr:MAG: hypothetical protein FE78DRAFT_509349 [Acidomyces sp. 'richmondensis']KYG43314.1 hypothetical protein M433DRAFT_362920 [Acidomyces richmondensis BFW]